jgi:hypothetical protein
MFSPEDRELLRQSLLAIARRDSRISGAAVTGSAALNREDVWSDIDLAFGVSEENEVVHVISDWTTLMYEKYGAAHHVDLTSGEVLYRAFFLRNTLQVDLSFAPGRMFGAVAPSFQLVFGTSNELPMSPSTSANELIGLGWLYALHARSSIERNHIWQAEYMISGFRDQVLGLACIRYGVSPNQGRGIDKVPREITGAFTGALVRSLDNAELKRAYRSCGEVFIDELNYVDSELASRLEEPLRELTKT